MIRPRLQAVVTVVAFASSLPTVVRAGPSPADPRAESVSALHSEGEELFAAGDFAGARNAWVDAYERIQRTETTWPYSATLLSLVVTAALAEHARNGRDDRLAEVVSLVEVARATPELSPETTAMLDETWTRLAPHIPKPEPEPEPEPEPVRPPPPVVVQPTPPDVSTDTEPLAGGPPGAWIGAGTVVLVGGVVAAIVGSRFEPRAVDLVDGTGDAETSEGRRFIDAERRKGLGWTIGGGVAAAVGTAALVTGLVLLVRSRR